MNKNYKISLMLMLALVSGIGTVNATEEFKRARSSGSGIEMGDFTESLRLMSPGKVGIISAKTNAYKDAVEQIEALGFTFGGKSDNNPVLWKDTALLLKITGRSISKEVTDAASAAADLVSTIHLIEKNVTKGSAESNTVAVKSLFSIVATDAPNKESVDKAFNNFGDSAPINSKLGKLLGDLSTLQKKVKAAKEAKGGIFVDENQMTELVTAFNSLGKITQSVQNMSSSLTAKIDSKEVTADPKALISKLTDALCSGPLTSIASDINAALSNVEMTADELGELDRMQLVLAKARSLIKLGRTTKGKAKKNEELIAGMNPLMNATKISDLIDFKTAPSGSAANLDINKAGVLSAEHGAVETAFALGTLLTKVNAKGGSQEQIVNGLLQVVKADQSSVGTGTTYKGFTAATSLELKANGSAIAPDEGELLSAIFESVQLPVSTTDDARTSKIYKPGTIFAASGDKVSNDLYNSLATIKFDLPSMSDDLATVDSKIVSVIKGRVDNKNITATLAKDCAEILKQVSTKLDSAEKLVESLRGNQKDRLMGSIKKLRATIKSINDNKTFTEAAGTTTAVVTTQQKPAATAPADTKTSNVLGEPSEELGLDFADDSFADEKPKGNLTRPGGRGRFSRRAASVNKLSVQTPVTPKSSSEEMKNKRTNSKGSSPRSLPLGALL